MKPIIYNRCSALENMDVCACERIIIILLGCVCVFVFVFVFRFIACLSLKARLCGDNYERIYNLSLSVLKTDIRHGKKIVLVQEPFAFLRHVMKT